jgi:serine/threonine protein kinase
VGEGSTGNVYKAVEVVSKTLNEREKKPMALKIIIKNMSDEYFDTLIERYQIIRQLDPTSQDFAKMQDWTQVNMYSQPVPNSLVLIQEFLEGKTLADSLYSVSFRSSSDYIIQKRSLELIEEFINFGIRILQKFSSHKIIYGDMSPKNVMITQDGKFKLIDFDSFYTPHLNKYLVFTGGYTPHEVAQGFSKSAPGASDLFSTSLIVAELLIGRHPADLYIDKRKKEVLKKFQADPLYNDLQSQTSPEILFWERISYPEILQNKVLFHEMQMTLFQELYSISNQIQDPKLKAKYIELSNFVIQTLEFEPQNRGFYWKDQAYSHQLIPQNCNGALAGKN